MSCPDVWGPLTSMDLSNCYDVVCVCMIVRVKAEPVFAWGVACDCRMLECGSDANYYTFAVFDPFASTRHNLIEE